MTCIARLVSTYYTGTPEGAVTFGTSGHRGSSLKGTFNEAHILAISQAVSEIRSATGPIILGKDTHALSEPASMTAVEVFAANGLDVILGEGYVPDTSDFSCGSGVEPQSFGASGRCGDSYPLTQSTGGWWLQV